MKEEGNRADVIFSIERVTWRGVQMRVGHVQMSPVPGNDTAGEITLIIF